MEYGVQTRGPYPEVLAVARWADDRGLACFAMPDHYLTAIRDPTRPAYDNLAMLAGLARDTSRIRLATLVSPITFRHPAVMAKNAVTIDEMSGGRFTLGVGTGWLLREHDVFGLPFPAGSERWERFEEALAYLRAVFAPGGTAFEGKYYELEAVDVGPAPSDGLQLVVGGTGPHRTPSLAGRYADEYNHAHPEPRAEMRRRIERARTEAEAAGRDPRALLISCSGIVVVGADDADYRRNLERTAELVNRSPGELEEASRKRGTPHGTPDRAADLLGTLAEAGVERFYVQSLGHLSVEQFEETLGLIGG